MSRGRRAPWGWWALYNLGVVPAWWAGLHAASLVDAKAGRALEARRRLFRRLEHQRDRLRGCLWFHASSAGEVEQARPLLRAARHSLLADRPLLLTVYSPSGYEHAVAQAEADHVEYLPLDTLQACDRMVRWLRPTALVYVRYDAWPNLVWTARAASVPLLLSSATLSPASRRHHRLLHPFFRCVYQSFDRIGCLSEEDANAFRELYGLDDGVVRVTGDSRFDQVLERSREAPHAPAVTTLRAQAWKYLALGSTWPADERRLVEALAVELRENPERGLLLVPHEPTPARLLELEKRLSAAGIESTRWSQLVEIRSGRRRSTAAARKAESWRVVLVDTLGQLAELYHACEIAYVGGGFGAGVHSVLEPAAAGLPLLFGPRHRRSREAQRLLSRQAAASVATSADMIRELRRLRSADARRIAGRAAREFLEEGSGCDRRNLELLEELIFPAGTSDQSA